MKSGGQRVEVEGWGIEVEGGIGGVPSPNSLLLQPHPQQPSQGQGHSSKAPEGRSAGAGVASCCLTLPQRNPPPSCCSLMLTMLLSPTPSTPGPTNPINQPFTISFFNIVSVTSSHWRKPFEMTTRDESHDKRSEETETSAGKRKLERTITDILRGRRSSCAHETRDG